MEPEDMVHQEVCCLASGGKDKSYLTQEWEEDPEEAYWGWGNPSYKGQQKGKGKKGKKGKTGSREQALNAEKGKGKKGKM